MGTKKITYWETFKGSYQMGRQKHRMFLLKLLRDKGVTSIFDNGCGTGPLYEIIREDKLPFIYKGTDYSESMIGVCRNTFPDGDFEVQDARMLDEKDNSWDCVLLLHSLDHLDDYRAAICEAKRVSEKYVCIVLWRPLIGGHENNLNSINRMHKKDEEEPWADTHLQDYSKEVLEETFADLGLIVEEFITDERINDEGSYNTLYLLRK